MQRQTTPCPSANKVTGQTRKASDTADNQNNLKGLTDMFIGYLLNCCENGGEVDDNVHATFINLSEQPRPIKIEPVTPQPSADYLTVSEYARKRKINGFNTNLCSRLSHKALRSCEDKGLQARFNPLGTRTYPASVLEGVFNSL